MEDSSGNEASLTILGGTKAGQRFVIEDSVDNIVIGSDPSCRFQIDLPGVSPVHARIWIDPQGVTVYETNSPRGLYVNDDRVVAQATLRNGDILWLGTPGDEEIVMIQCRFPQRGAARPVYVPPPVDEDAIGETLALGARPLSPGAAARPEEAASEPEASAEPAVTEPEETERAEPVAASAEPPAPPTEVFMVEDVPAPTFPSEAAKFDVDFTKPGLPSTFEEEIEGTVADVPRSEPEPEAPPPPLLVPTSPPPVIASPPPPPPPPRRETPPPMRAEAPPAPPRRTAVRAAPVAPAPAEGPGRGIPAVVMWGGFAAGLVLVALGTYVGVRILRGTPPAGPASPPPTSMAAAAPTAVAPLPPVEPTPEPSAPAPEPEASPSAPPIEEEVTIVTPPPPTAAAPAPSQRTAPTPRPTQRAAATPPPTAPPPALDAQRTQLAAQVASLLGQAENAARGRSFEAAIRDYDEVLRLDPQNSRAVQGKAEAQAAAASYKRSFAPGRTSMSGKQAKADNLGGFDTAGVKVAKVPDYSGRIEFEVSPARVLPGDRYTVRIFLVNDGKKPFKVGSVSVNTTTNGTPAGGSVPVRAREVEPRDRMVLDERTAEWPAGVSSWTLEAVVQTDRDATFTNRLNWR